MDHFPRIGLGWDRHRLQSGRPCWLAGVEIPSPVGPSGHSDGDVLLHALTDAVLGAAGLDDLGTLFPDTDPQWAGASSTMFLEAALRRCHNRGWKVASADLVLVCDRPKISPFRGAMRKRLSQLLQLAEDRVNLKGKTTEGANSEYMEAQAVVLLIREMPAQASG
ncbi:MAG: 2-C-methyl-D-erythritol 2,4-cyclodiphosphate synthase [Planctomycetota bacterium]|nr:MAG: 2-C-methyl-D-erythritol 2,4-cyclodiphosphate synthase [Planctomycetota bacterium]